MPSSSKQHAAPAPTDSSQRTCNIAAVSPVSSSRTPSRPPTRRRRSATRPPRGGVAMFQLVIEVDELALQEAAAALDTTTAAETVLLALAIATEVGRGRRLANRQVRTARSSALRRRRR